MKLVRSLRVSARSLLRHRLRTALAMSGLVIGVAVVLVMVGIGEGAKHEVLQQIGQLGTDMLVVTPAEVSAVPGRVRQANRATTLRLSDSEAIASECASVVRAAPGRSGARQIKYGQRSTTSTILGTTPEYQEVRNAAVAMGRYFTAAEAMAAHRVAVVGTTVVENLFLDANPLGSYIRIGYVPFEVIGVLAAKGTSVDGGGDEDNQVLVPVRTAMRRLFNVDHLDSIYVQAAGRDRLSRAESEIAALLRYRHDLNRLRRPDDFTVEDQALALRAEMDTANSFTAMIAGFAGLSLFVGGVGILSIMLITVRERTGEIGLRMAIGARPRDILMQFVAEALMLGVCGGVLGLLLGLGTSLGIGHLTEWTTHVPLVWVTAALVASVVLGLGAGVFPATRAARMDPIVALRAE